MDEEYIEKYAREYDTEIENYEVSVRELNRFGVRNRILSSEILLYKIYGDEIINNIIDDTVDTGKTKKITKITDSEINQNQGYQKILVEIQNSKFDENLEVVLGKLGER